MIDIIFILIKSFGEPPRTLWMRVIVILEENTQDGPTSPLHCLCWFSFSFVTRLYVVVDLEGVLRSKIEEIAC